MEELIRKSCGYHYITVPGHPSDIAVGLGQYAMYHYITVPGHPSDRIHHWLKIKLYHYITVPGHPSDMELKVTKKREIVPLHYSSGASIRLIKLILCEKYWRTITLQFRGIHPTTQGSSVWLLVPLHYSSGASIRLFQIDEYGRNMYHYITVPGHPSDWISMM